jgi:hypothetical protein
MITLSERTYRVQGWQKTLYPETLKVNVMVSKATPAIPGEACWNHETPCIV